MATAALQRLEDILQCSVCLSTVQDGKVLECQHSFCLTCIQAVYDKHVSKNPSSVAQVPCPMCKVTSRIPSGDVTKLPNDLRTNEVVDVLGQLAAPPQFDENVFKSCGVCSKKKGTARAQFVCFDCAKMLCNNCLQKHNSNPRSTDHVHSRLTSDDISSLVCREHEEIVSCFCLSCSEAICGVCTLTSHDEHPNEVFTMSKGVTNRVELMICEADKKYDELVSRFSEMDNLQQTFSRTTKEKIQKHKQKFIDQLEEDEKKLFQTIDKDENEFRKALSKITAGLAEVRRQVDEMKKTNKKITTPLLVATDVRLGKPDNDELVERVQTQVDILKASEIDLPEPTNYRFVKGSVAMGSLTKVTKEKQEDARNV